MRVYFNTCPALYHLKGPTEERLDEPIDWQTYVARPFGPASFFNPRTVWGVIEYYRKLARELETGAIVCYSLIRVGDFYNFYLFYRELAALPQSKAIKLIVGGSLLRVLDIDDFLERFPRVTSAVLGPGERVLPELLKQLKHCEEPARLVEGDNADRNPWPDPGIIDQTGSYFCSVALDKCTWGRCKFCHHLTPDSIEDSSVEEFSERLIQKHRDHGLENFFIYDNNLRPRDLEILLQRLQRAELGGKIRLSLFGVRLDPGFLDVIPLAKEVDVVRWMNWGMESCSQRLLNLYAKGIRVKHFEPLLKGFSEIGVANRPYFMHGLPGTTDEDLRESFEHVDRLRPYFAALYSSWFILSEGVRLWDEKEKFGIEVLEPYHMSDATGVGCQTDCDVKTRFLDFCTHLDGRTMTRQEDLERYLPYIKGHLDGFPEPNLSPFLFFTGSASRIFELYCHPFTLPPGSEKYLSGTRRPLQSAFSQRASRPLKKTPSAPKASWGALRRPGPRRPCHGTVAQASFERDFTKTS